MSDACGPYSSIISVSLGARLFTTAATAAVLGKLTVFNLVHDFFYKTLKWIRSSPVFVVCSSGVHTLYIVPGMCITDT